MGCGERDKERSRVSKKGGRSAPVFPRLSIVSRASRELRERAFQQLKDFVRVPHRPQIVWHLIRWQLTTPLRL